MATYTWIDSNVLIYYAKGMGAEGLNLLLNLNSQLLITDAVKIEATREGYPGSDKISAWINDNATPGPNGEPPRIMIPSTAEGAALQQNSDLTGMGEQSILSNANAIVQTGDTVQIYSGDKFSSSLFDGQTTVSSDDVSSVADSLNDIRQATGMPDPTYETAKDSLIQSGANPKGFQSEQALDLNNSDAQYSTSSDIQAAEGDTQSFASLVKKFSGDESGSLAALDALEGAGIALEALGAAGIAAALAIAGEQALQQAEAGDYSGAAQTIANAGGALAGALAGAEAGGQLGAELGAFLGPEGAVAGALLAGVAGAIAGADTVENAAKLVRDGVSNAVADVANFFTGSPSGNGGNASGGSGSGGSGSGGGSPFRGQEQYSRQKGGGSLLLSPYSQLAAHTIGGVVTPAQPLLVVVPADDHLEIEARVSNQDIGFVDSGQEAEIKVETFNFTRYGLLHGRVLSISRDAIAPATADERSRDRAQGNSSDSSTPRTQEPVYAARTSLDRTQMTIENKPVNLAPGMAVTAEIKTGERRIISYLLSPLRAYKEDSLRER